MRSLARVSLRPNTTVSVRQLGWVLSWTRLLIQECGYHCVFFITSYVLENSDVLLFTCLVQLKKTHFHISCFNRITLDRLSYT